MESLFIYNRKIESQTAQTFFLLLILLLLKKQIPKTTGFTKRETCRQYEKTSIKKCSNCFQYLFLLSLRRKDFSHLVCSAVLFFFVFSPPLPRSRWKSFQVLLSLIIKLLTQYKLHFPRQIYLLSLFFYLHFLLLSCFFFLFLSRFLSW